METVASHELQALAFENLPSLACVFTNPHEIIPNRQLRELVDSHLPPGKAIELSSIISPENLKKLTEGINSLSPSLPSKEIEFAIRNQQTENKTLKMGWNITGIFDKQGELQNIVGIGKDVTEKKKQEEKLRVDAYIDSLTGLYNRNFFEAQKQLINKKRQVEDTCVLVFDLNNLKTVNDQIGHLAGDQLILGLAQILKNTFRSEDMLCRIGGDEFLVICENLPPSQINTLLERLSNKTIEYNTSHKSDLIPEVDYARGYSFLRQERKPLDAAFKRADLEMYREKAFSRYPGVLTGEELDKRISAAISS